MLAALENAKCGLNGALFTGADTIGGLHRGIKVPTTTPDTETLFIDSHVNFIPDTEATHLVLERMQHFIPDLQWTSHERGPITFQNGVTQPFLGFGSHNVDAVDFYSYFTQPQQLHLNKTLAHITQQLLTLFTGDVFTNHEVTDVRLVEGLGQIQTNGSDVYQAQRVYFMDSPSKLTKSLLADSSDFAKSAVQRLSKSTLWTAVSLTYLHHTPQTETPAMHILYGAKDVPCVGVFQAADGRQVSHWLSILSSEQMGDTEQMGVIIREMKKQIKRIYPHFSESVEREFIMVAPDAYGQVPTQVTNSPDVFKNNVVLVAGSYYSDHLGLWGECASYLKLADHFLAPEPTLPVEKPLDI